MSETVAGQATPSPNSEAAQYEAMRKELGLEAEPTVEPLEPESQVETELREPPAEPDKRRPEHVPYAEHENVQKALRESREQAKAANEQLARFMRIVEEARAPAKKDEAPKLPDKLEDPIGYYDGRIAQLEAQLAEAQQGGQVTAEQLQAWQQKQYMNVAISQSEADIRNPQSTNYKADYDDAIAHIRTTRAAELNMLYPDESPVAQQIAASQGFRSVGEMKNAIFEHDASMVTQQAMTLGIMPAQYYYQLAVGRGYQPKAAKANGADKANQQMEAAKRGSAAAVTISGGSGGRKGADDMALRDLADLFVEDPEAADKVWDQMRRAGKLG